MKRYFILRVLILFISFAILSLWLNPLSSFRKKSNTIVLNDKPINISSIENTSTYTEIDTINSFKINSFTDSICWVNTNEILLSSFSAEDIMNDGMTILDVKNNSLTELALKAHASSYLVSPVGNKFLYNNLQKYPEEFIGKLYKYPYSINYNKYELYSLLDNTSVSLPEGLSIMEWLPDGSGFIGKWNDSNNIVIYDLDSKTTKPILDNTSDIDTLYVNYFIVSKDGSSYYFSYLDSETGLYSIYKMNKQDMLPQKIVSDMSISGNIEVLNDNLLLLTNPARRTIFIYDTEKHEKYKTITTSSAEFYISNDKSMLVFIERGKSTKLSVVNLNDPNLTPTEIFQNSNYIPSVNWSNDNKLAFQLIDSYNGNNIVYTYSFK